MQQPKWLLYFHIETVFNLKVSQMLTYYTETTECLYMHAWFIPAKPLYNSDTVSVHFNYLYCVEICDKIRRGLAMVTYICFNVDECWLTSSMPQQTFKLQISLNYAYIEQIVLLWCVVDMSFNLVRVHITLLFPYRINNDIHSPVCLIG